MGSNDPFSFRRRAKGRRATFYIFFVKLHNFHAKKHSNFVQYFFPKPIDIRGEVWYNISVKGRERQAQMRLGKGGKLVQLQLGSLIKGTSPVHYPCFDRQLG